jgi:hypothetical protein
LEWRNRDRVPSALINKGMERQDIDTVEMQLEGVQPQTTIAFPHAPLVCI